MGDENDFCMVMDMVVPSHVRRFYDAILADPSSARVANAMTQAAAQLEAGGHGIPDNASEERIGLLQAVQPSVLGVEIAYGGYLASGVIRAAAFHKIVNAA